jgi:hypothetical protein
MTRLNDKEAFSTDGPQCPYCLCTITPDEGFYFDANNYTEGECPDCQRKFKVEVHIETSWASRKCEAAR